MLSRLIIFHSLLTCACLRDSEGPESWFGGACDGLCSCEEKDGVLHVNCEDRNIKKISEVQVGWDRPFHLNLYKNDLVELLPEDMERFENAVTLHLGANSIQELEPGVFGALGSLKKLHINSNFLVMLKEDTFHGLVNLEYLQADTNFIRVVEPGAFSKLVRLKVLILNDNAVEFLPANIFRFVPLTHLDLRGNRLQTLPYVGFLEHVGRIIELLLEDNSWVCDCQIVHLKIWMENMRAQASIGDVVCSSPHHLRGSMLAKVKRDVLCPSHTQISLEEPSQSLDMAVTPSTRVLQVPDTGDDAKIPTPAHAPRTLCVAQCSCFRHPIAGFLVHCEDSGIQRISDLGILQQSPSKLVLTGNMIQRLLKYDFVTYDSLELLNLANNQIDYVDNETFLSLSHLKKLYLNGNRLGKISATMFLGLHNLESLYLEFNVIKEIEAGSFNPLTKLKLLFLNNNLLSALPAQIFRNVPLTKLNLRTNLFTHLPVSNVLDQLDFLEQIHLEDNPWDCTCDLVSLKQWLERLKKDMATGPILCHSPRKVSSGEIRSLKTDVLCPGLVTHSSSSAEFGLQPTAAPKLGTGGFFHSLTEAIPLSVLILCLLILFLTVIFCSAGVAVFVLHRRRRESKSKQTEEQPRESSPIHLHYSMYGRKTTHHMAERHGGSMYDPVPRSPVVQVCRNPSYCSRHKERDPEDHEAEKPCRGRAGLTDGGRGSPPTPNERPGEFVPLADPGSLYRSLLERERELQQLGITEYLKRNIPQLPPATDGMVPGQHEELKLMEALVYARPRKVAVEQTTDEYFELKAKLHTEPDYLEVLEHQTAFT
ncbi:SLIT and NTRK-like protein 6 [Electrophorus electricus]|uniref:LRRCT domain-containing protein n=1 Tax=Electrophorus electricus TaxID=8005 RepID=A0A4W4ERR6_ELEEL|nr:SLIT and NTRK-like protein 6 [Electrophorus electricus]